MSQPRDGERRALWTSIVAKVAASGRPGSVSPRAGRRCAPSVHHKAARSGDGDALAQLPTVETSRSSTPSGDKSARMAASATSSAAGRNVVTPQPRSAGPRQAQVKGNGRPARSSLGIHSPSTEFGPHTPAGRLKRQIGASFHAARHCSPSRSRLAGSTVASQAAHGSVKLRGNPARTTLRRPGTLP
jgi:hypothetical protein